VKSLAAVFKARSEAERGVTELRSLNIEPESINLLTAQTTSEELAKIPKAAADQSGTMQALGALVGGVTGFAGGWGLAALVLPGVGPVVALGVAGGAILGAMGAFTGGAILNSVDSALTEGIPRDELFIYEDALRQGRSVVIAILKEESQSEAARAALEKAGAESIDSAREKWWLGLRDVEKEHYDAGAARFDRDEMWYRRGFEVALDLRNQGKSYQDARAQRSVLYPDLYDERAESAFRRGYERGQAYRKSHRAAGKAA
jgi:hypothetical protein